MPTLITERINTAVTALEAGVTNLITAIATCLGYRDAAATSAALAATNAAAVDKNNLVAGPGFYQNHDGTYIFDDFATDADNTTLNGKAAKGNKAGGATWSLTGLGQLTTVVFKGAIKCVANTYNSIGYGGPVNRIAGVFRFDPTTGEGPPAMIIQNGTGLSHMVHPTLSNKGLTLTKVTALGGGGVFVGMALFNSDGINIGTQISWDLKTDGTLYCVAIELDHTAQTVTIVAPDGKRYTTAADADLFSLELNTGTWQGSGWVAVEMGKRSQAAKLVQLGHGVHKGELTALRGQAIGYRRPGIMFPITTVGWYRIANSTAGYRAFAIFGKFNITAITQSYNSTMEFVGACDNGGQMVGASGIILNYHNGTGGTSPAITKTRFSWLSSTSCALDIYVARADTPGNVWVDFEGVGALVDDPVVGAVAQATGNVEYTIPTSSLNRAPNEPCAFSRLTLGGFNSYSQTGSVDIRYSNSGNRYAFHDMIGNGNFTASQAWGVNSVTSDAAATTVMTLNGTGLLVGGSSGANAPFHAKNSATTSSRQSGLRFESGAGSGQTIHSLEFADGLGVAAAVDALREGGGFGHTLRFWTMNSGGTLTNVVNANSAGDLVVGIVANTGVRFGSGGPFASAGSGSPEGVLSAPVGSTYHRTNGGAGTSQYKKESGTGNTGWVAY